MLRSFHCGVSQECWMCVHGLFCTQESYLCSCKSTMYPDSLASSCSMLNCKSSVTLGLRLSSPPFLTPRSCHVHDAHILAPLCLIPIHMGKSSHVYRINCSYLRALPALRHLIASTCTSGDSAEAHRRSWQRHGSPSGSLWSTQGHNLARRSM